MNTLTSTPVDTYNHPPSHQAPVRRVSLPDRLALHLGLALITWSRRPRTIADPPSLAELHARNERALEREGRERDWQLASYLSQPR